MAKRLVVPTWDEAEARQPKTPLDVFVLKWEPCSIGEIGQFRHDLLEVLEWAVGGFEGEAVVEYSGGEREAILQLCDTIKGLLGGGGG